VLVGVASTPASSCVGSAFACLESADCSDGAMAGTCEPTGWCSFDDPDCESGARYGEHAGGGLAGQCVDPAGTTTDASTSLGSASSTTATTTDATTSSTTEPATTTTTTDDTTDDTGIPACGDGDLDPSELCDDGNTTPGDGCSETCVPSGSVIWERQIPGDVGAHGDTLDRFSNGDLAVGFAVELDDGALPGVWRLDAAGEVVWTWTFVDTGWTDAYTWGLDVAALEDGDHVLVGVDGIDGQQPIVGAAMLDAEGALEWDDFVVGARLYGAALQSTGQGYFVGIDIESGGEGVLGMYSVAGVLTELQHGEPVSPLNGFAYDVMLDGDAIYVAGNYADAETQTAFLGAIAGAVGQRYEFAPTTYNEGLAVALDPRSGRRWIAGFAGELGGWVGAVEGDGVVLDATIVTETFHANLHGIAVDPTGAAIAVGWDSSLGTRDPYIVKVAVDGAKIWTARVETAAGDDDLRDVEIAPNGSVFVVGTRVDDGGVAAAWVAQLVP